MLTLSDINIALTSLKIDNLKTVLYNNRNLTLSLTFENSDKSKYIDLTMHNANLGIDFDVFVLESAHERPYKTSYMCEFPKGLKQLEITLQCISNIIK